MLKLSQGEFVTVSKLEAAFTTSPLIAQIYLYGNSSRPYLLAVVVPTDEARAGRDEAELKSVIAESLQTVAQNADLQSYEIPRDFIIETTPFTVENGLLLESVSWPGPDSRSATARYWNSSTPTSPGPRQTSCGPSGWPELTPRCCPR